MKNSMFIICFFLAGITLADNTPSETLNYNYINISIESVLYDSYPETDTLDVILKTALPIGGFDLTLAGSSANFRITDVLTGDFVNQCRWEYFNTKETEHPIGGWQVVALAQMIADTTRKVCHYIDSSVTLCRLVVNFKPISQIMPTSEIGKITFKWNKCKDNTISSVSGDTLYVFNKLVSDDSGTTNTQSYIPQESCYKNVSERIRKQINFTNGIVDFKFDR